MKIDNTFYLEDFKISSEESVTDAAKRVLEVLKVRNKVYPYTNFAGLYNYYEEGVKQVLEITHWTNFGQRREYELRLVKVVL